MALPFLRARQGEPESPLAESSAAVREYDEDVVSGDQGGGEGASHRRPAAGQKAWSATMFASDTASSPADSGWTVGESGWPESQQVASESDSEPSLADDRGVRPAAYRQLWGPPKHPTPRQALGRPYVWDGGPSDVAGLQPAGDDDDDAPEPVAAVRSRRPAARRGSELLTGPAPTAARAVIGDELRELAAWCQIGACIARHTDRGALGEADIKNKAVAAGWCVDLFGRLICPSCQQRYAVWSARPLVRADRAGDLLAVTADAQTGRHRRIRWPAPPGVDSAT